MSSPIANRDYYLIIDKSGTMWKKDMQGGTKTRWDAMQESTYALAAKVLGLDPDGISIYVFSTRYKCYPNVKSSEKITDIFMENEPCGGTNLAPVLRAAFTEYFSNKGTPAHKANGATVLVVTDGLPDDKQHVVDEIAAAARSVQSDKEIGVSFIQVGHDPEATEFLKYLDTELPKVLGGKDIVNTVKIDDIEEKGLTQVLQDAIFS